MIEISKYSLTIWQKNSINRPTKKPQRAGVMGLYFFTSLTLSKLMINSQQASYYRKDLIVLVGLAFFFTHAIIYYLLIVNYGFLICNKQIYPLAQTRQ